jgi:hypothetical protein
MAEFVDNNVINDPNWGHDDFPVELHTTVGGAAPPARLEGFDANTVGMRPNDSRVTVHFNSQLVVGLMFEPLGEGVSDHMWLFGAMRSRHNQATL